MIALTLLCGVVLIPIVLKIYIKWTTGWCKSPLCLVGKTVIVTGSNTGIGYETACNMAMRGAKVILACRNKEKATEARDKIIKITNNPNIIIRMVDMMSFASVKKFAKEIVETEDRLDILINNAGVGYLPDSRTEDGCQTVVQVNYYSPVLLTLLLIDLLKKTPNSRIVNVASIAARGAKLNLNDPDEFTLNQESIVYCNTKLCNILFTIELAKRLRNTTITTYSLHPGVVYTEFFRNMPTILKFLFNNTIRAFFKSVEEGAQTTIYCAIEKGIEEYSGKHFADCARIAWYHTVTEEKAQVLWDKTMKVLEVTPPELF